MAGLGARAGAFIADYLIIYLILFLFVLVHVTLLAGSAFSWFPILGGLALFLFFWRRAQSPGKAAFGLQVVNRDGTPTKTARMLVREVLLKGVVVNSILAIAFIGFFVWHLLAITLIGLFVWSLWPDKEGRAPHDMILGTHVVQAESRSEALLGPHDAIGARRTDRGWVLTVRQALARLFTVLALASLAAVSTFVVWAVVSPTGGPFWSANPELGGDVIVRMLATVILLPLTLAAALALGTAARLVWQRGR